MIPILFAELTILAPLKSGLIESSRKRRKGELALLMLTGWCANRTTMFSQLAEECGKRRRVLVLDWRGHGLSEMPKGDFGADDLVEEALAVIEASGAQQIVPVRSTV